MRRRPDVRQQSGEMSLEHHEQSAPASPVLYLWSPAWGIAPWSPFNHCSFWDSLTWNDTCLADSRHWAVSILLLFPEVMKRSMGIIYIDNRRRQNRHFSQNVSLDFKEYKLNTVVGWVMVKMKHRPLFFSPHFLLLEGNWMDSLFWTS